MTKLKEGRVWGLGFQRARSATITVEKHGSIQAGMGVGRAESSHLRAQAKSRESEMGMVPGL